MSENKFENGFNGESVIDGTENISADENKIKEAPLTDTVQNESDNAQGIAKDTDASGENLDSHTEETADTEGSEAAELYPETVNSEDDPDASEDASDGESNTTEENPDSEYGDSDDEEDVYDSEDGDSDGKEDVYDDEDGDSDGVEDVYDDEDGDSDGEEDVYDDEDGDSDGEGDVYDDEDGELENAEDGLEDGEDESSEDEDNEKKKKKPGTRGIDSLFDFVELFIFSLAAVFIITTFFFRHSVVDGSSMERTLFDGEHIIISDLFYKPERGDIIVCEDYSTELPIPIVKRVIGIAGDRVEIDAAGTVKVNGVTLDESDYVYIDPYYPYDCDVVDIIVPEGEVFVMGDHRNVSSDSRKIGTIKEDSILGKVLFRFYPFDKFGAVE